jgi:hypothetical protein
VLYGHRVQRKHLTFTLYPSVRCPVNLTIVDQAVIGEYVWPEDNKQQSEKMSRTTDKRGRVTRAVATGQPDRRAEAEAAGS